MYLSVVGFFGIFLGYWYLHDTNYVLCKHNKVIGAITLLLIRYWTRRINLTVKNLIYKPTQISWRVFLKDTPYPTPYILIFLPKVAAQFDTTMKSDKNVLIDRLKFWLVKKPVIFKVYITP